MAHKIYIVEKNIDTLHVVTFTKPSAYIQYVTEMQTFCRNRQKAFIEYKVATTLKRVLKLENILIEK